VINTSDALDYDCPSQAKEKKSKKHSLPPPVFRYDRNLRYLGEYKQCRAYETEICPPVLIED
jgi:hypothetical protein